MNIFYLDENPKKAAEYHYDKHCHKMILEAAQMMSCVWWMYDIKEAKKLHKKGLIYSTLSWSKHPCSKWVAYSYDNFHWLYKLSCYLNEERKYRFNSKDHKSWLLIQNIPTPPFRDNRWSEPYKAVGDLSRHIEDPVEAYRNCYKTTKFHLFGYTKREIPYWFNKELNNEY